MKILRERGIVCPALSEQFIGSVKKDNARAERRVKNNSKITGGNMYVQLAFLKK